MLASAPIRPNLLVGIPVRNQLPFVRMCLETLSAQRPEDSHILIIDDASEPECRNYLEEFAATTAGTSLSRNDKQRGFPYCCNEIINRTSEAVICLLNSDTVVSPGWANYVLQVMDLDASFAIAGPSTSFTHTRQSLPGLKESRMNHNPETVAALARVVLHCYPGQYESMPTLGGFCLFFKREVVNRIGYFDERFGLGGGEEDDFIARSRRTGLKAIWVKYSYVHHFGHCSFTQEMESQSARLWAKNRLIYEIKQLRPEIREVVHFSAGK